MCCSDCVHSLHYSIALLLPLQYSTAQHSTAQHSTTFHFVYVPQSYSPRNLLIKSGSWTQSIVCHKHITQSSALNGVQASPCHDPGWATVPTALGVGWGMLCYLRNCTVPHSPGKTMFLQNNTELV